MKTKWFLRAFAILAGISFAACGDKDKDVTPVFPDSTSHTVAAGETKELTFTANTTWTLTADKTWIAFMNGNEEVPSKTGKAGPVTITVKVKDTNHDFDDAVADLVLAMQGKTQTIFTITRPAKERQVKMYKKDGAAYHELSQVELEYQLGRTASLQIGFTANFDWKVLSKTEGIVLGTDLYGLANQTTSGEGFRLSYISLPEDMLSEAFDGKIVISDLNDENPFEFAVTYDGMDGTDLFFSEDYLRAATTASVSFSNKGFLMGREATPKPTEETSFSFTATTKGMKSKGFVVTLNGENQPEIATDPWLALTGDNEGNYSIEVDGRVNLGDTRDAYVIILPEALATNPDFTPYFDAEGIMKGLYGFKVSQAAAPSGAGLFLGWNGGLSPVSDEELIPWAEHSFSRYGIDPPSDFIWGLNVAGENTYVYDFYGTDIDGDLIVAVTGIEASGFSTYTGGTHLSGTKTADTFQDRYCVVLSGVVDFTEGSAVRHTYVAFTKSGSSTQILAILLRQHKTVE